MSELKLRFIKIPERLECKRIHQKFMARGKFPDVFGSVGSTCIAVKSPGKALADGYMNEKGYYSFRAMVKFLILFFF